MKRGTINFLAILFSGVLILGAAEEEDFEEIVAAIRMADELIEEGKDRQAIAQYELTRKRLLQFQEDYPDWDRQVVGFRLKYVTEKLEQWNSGTSSSATSATAVETDQTLQGRAAYLERANSQYQFQLKQLHAENARLSTKLREALALRPAAHEPSVIAQNQAKLKKAQSDLVRAMGRISELEAELESYPEPEEAKQNVKLLEETRKNLNLVLQDAEELRVLNEQLRQEAAEPITVETPSASLKRSVAAAQAAQKQAEEEAAALRIENEQLNLRLVALETRFTAASIARRQKGAPKLSAADSARLALAENDSETAVTVLREALKSDSSNAELRYLMARALVIEGNPVEAEVHLKKVLELSPESGVTHFELARLYLDRDAQNPGLARWHYHKALNLGYPRDPQFEAEINWEQPGG